MCCHEFYPVMVRVKSNCCANSDAAYKLELLTQTATCCVMGDTHLELLDFLNHAVLPLQLGVKTLQLLVHDLHAQTLLFLLQICNSVACMPYASLLKGHK